MRRCQHTHADKRYRTHKGVDHFHSTEYLSVTFWIRSINKIFKNTESQNVLEVTKGKSQSFKPVVRAVTILPESHIALLSAAFHQVPSEMHFKEGRGEEVFPDPGRHKGGRNLTRKGGGIHVTFFFLTTIAISTVELKKTNCLSTKQRVTVKRQHGGVPGWLGPLSLRFSVFNWGQDLRVVRLLNRQHGISLRLSPSGPPAPKFSL